MRLRDQPGPHRLGDNMHCLQGHPRLDFVLLWHRPGTVLDVGSGEGAFGLALHNEGNTVTLMDIFPVEPPAPGIEVLTMSIYDRERVAEMRGMFDTVLFMEVIEHLEDPFFAIGHCMYMLKPGGRLLITTPHVDTWDDEPDHLWRFSFDDLLLLVHRWIKPPDYCLGALHLFQDDTFLYCVMEKGNGK